MTNTKRCILLDYRNDSCANCTNLCAHRISLHGLNGTGGRSAQANIPRDYRYVTLKTSPARKDQARAYKIIDEYVKTFRRHLEGGERSKSLYLWSDEPGTGKTTTAVALINAWMSIEYLTALKYGKQPAMTGAYFLDVTELQTSYNLATMTDDEAGMRRIGDEIKRAQNANFAVIDDIGTRSSTEAFTAYIHAVINGRTTQGLPTVYTSNLPVEGMRRIFTDRLYDRIRDQCLEIEFTGKSKRGMRK